MKYGAVVRSMRAPFLILTPVCVFLGLSTAIVLQVSINISSLLLVLLGALLAHIAVNTLNEYSDFKSGLDLKTKRTAFSGGSGALVQNPEMASTVFFTSVISIVGTLLIGTYFIVENGVSIIPVGLIGILLIITYTDKINNYPLLCLIAPGLGFGVLMVVGTHYVLAGEYAVVPWLVSIVPFFLINNLLLLNQYPDVDADKTVGRNHFPIAYSIAASNRIYALFLLASIVTIIAGVIAGLLPQLSLAALLPMPLAVISWSGAVKYGQSIGEYPMYLACNVVTAITVPLLLGVTLIMA